MTKIIQSLEDMRSHAQQLVTAIAGGTNPSDLHASALELLLKIVELQAQVANAYPNDTEPSREESKDGDDAVSEEIAKVARKLPKWAQNPSQINSRILTLFLKLKRSGIKVITEDQLCEEYGDVSEFYRNFPQMKSISPKNHAKVFDSAAGVVRLWTPVKQYIDEFERLVFSDSKE